MNPVRPLEWEYYLPLETDNGPVKSMLELGNKINGSVTYKSFFEGMGIQHTSIDWNGKDGALKLDLRKPLDLGPFDMVTNIGTTEHVNGQAQVWENIHNMTKVGGVLVSTTPYADGQNWLWHGRFYPKQSFFTEFARLNGWIVEKMAECNGPPRVNTHVRLRKVEDRPFQMPSMDHFFVNMAGPV